MESHLGARPLAKRHHLASLWNETLGHAARLVDPQKTLPYIAFSFFLFFLFIFILFLGLTGQQAINAFRVDLQLHQSLRRVHLVEPH
jgi:hypothetical protein